MSCVTNRLIFDPTDANSIAASSSIGAFVRAGTDGDLIGSETLNALEWLRVSGPIIDSSGNEVAVTSNALDVNIAAAPGLGIYAEDSAHSSGDDGQQILAVRQDTLAASTSADGDYASFKSNNLGELYVTDTDVLAELQGGISVDDGGGSLTVDASDLDIRDLTAASDSVDAWLNDGSGNAIGSTGGSLDVNVTNSIDLDDDLADTAIENTATAVSAAAINVVASALASRKWLATANEGNKSLYFGKTGVTTTNGYPLHPGMQHVWRIGPSVTPQVIGGTGASSEDMRVMELS